MQNIKNFMNICLITILALNSVVIAGGDKSGYKPGLETIKEEPNQKPVYKQSQPSLEEDKIIKKQAIQKSSWQSVKGFAKLAGAALASMASYELFQQARNQKSYFGGHVNQLYNNFEQKHLKIQHIDKRLPLTITQGSLSAILGALAVSLGISGVKDLVK
jgi:hypothetical protein